MFVSMLSGKELAQLERFRAISLLGVVYKGVIVQPPKCPVCGGYAIIVDLNGKFLQCSECGNVSKMYEFEDLFFAKYK